MMAPLGPLWMEPTSSTCRSAAHHSDQAKALGHDDIVKHSVTGVTVASVAVSLCAAVIRVHCTLLAMLLHACWIAHSVNLVWQNGAMHPSVCIVL